MRGYIATLLNGDAKLRTLGLPANCVFSAENVDTPDSTRPFIVIRWTDRQGGFRRSPSQPNLCDIWCYDTRGDFSRIDQMLARIKALLDPIAAVKTDVGYITQIDWVGDGGDNYDDVYKAICRTATYRVIGSVAGP